MPWASCADGGLAELTDEEEEVRRRLSDALGSLAVGSGGSDSDEGWGRLRAGSLPAGGAIGTSRQGSSLRATSLRGWGELERETPAEAPMSADETADEEVMCRVTPEAVDVSDESLR